MIDKQKAIAALEVYRSKCKGVMASTVAECIRVIRELPEDAEKNDPLTLEELREIDGDKIYIHYIGHCEGFYEDEMAPYYGKYERYVQKYNGMLRGCDLPLKYYGDEWLAYRYKPGERRDDGNPQN